MARTGRPSKLSDVIATRPVIDPTTKQPTGETVPVTRTEQIVGDIRIGSNVERACRRAGITKQTFYDWERQASELRERIASSDTEIALTEKQATLLDFSDSLHDAEMAWHLQMEMNLQGLAQGGLQVVEVHTTTGKDGEVEVRTVTKTLPPDKQVLFWRLKHKFPGEYRETVEISGTGEGGAVSLELRADAVGDALAQFLASKALRDSHGDGGGSQQERSESGSDDSGG